MMTMGPSFRTLTFLTLPALFGFSAQQLQCSTLVDGCDKGGTYDTLLRRAIAAFEAGKLYGGNGLPIVFSTSLSGNTLAQISYSCLDGSVPPPVYGSAVQSRLQNVLSCANKCGSITLTDGSNCGFGVLITEGADAKCFSKALDIIPEGMEGPEKPSVDTFNSLGCWTDSASARALTGGHATAEDMTVEKCANLARGFKYAGLEYRVECHWGNTIASTSSQAPGQCDMACSGDPSELCGGGNLINIYQNSAYVPPPDTNPGVGTYSFAGCYADSEERTLQNQVTDSQMTVGKCTEIASGAKYAAVENGDECWYGDALASSATADGCTTICAGYGGEFCGGGWRLSLYINSAWQPGSIVPSVEAFNTIGCFLDQTDARVLVADSNVDQSATGMTVEKCVAFAHDRGWKYAGVEYGGECWVGNTLHEASQAPDDNCNMPCAGNRAELCGSGNRVQIYEDSSWVYPTAADIVAALREYNETLSEVVQLIQEYKNDIVALQASQGGTKSRMRRAPTYNPLVDYRTRFSGLRQRLRGNSDQMLRSSSVGSTSDIELQQLVPRQQQDAIRQLVDAAITQLDILVRGAEEDAEAIISAQSAGTGIPALPLAERAAAAAAAALAVGIPATAVGTATGIFAVLINLLSFFGGLGPGPGTGPEISTTTTIVAPPTPTDVPPVLTKTSTTTSEITEVPPIPTKSMTTSTISSLCDPCSAIGLAALALATQFPSNPMERDVGWFPSKKPRDSKPDGSSEPPSNKQARWGSLLEKRGGRSYSTSAKLGNYGVSFGKFQPVVEFCDQDSGFTFHAGVYPSTSRLQNSPQLPDGSGNSDDGDPDTIAGGNNAPELEGIGLIPIQNRFQSKHGPFADMMFIFSMNSPETGERPSAEICDATIAGFVDRLYGTNPELGALDGVYFDKWRYSKLAQLVNPPHVYHTEHVFELHIIKDFFYWIFQNNFATCKELKNIFDNPDNGGGDTIANLMMKQLAYYDATKGAGPLSELFVLEENLNMLKGAIMNGRPLDEIERDNKVLPRGDDGITALAHIEQAAVVVDFLKVPNVRAAFENAMRRVRNLLSDFDNFPELIDAELPHGLKDAGYESWADAWLDFMQVWVDKRRSDLLSWVREQFQVIALYFRPCEVEGLLVRFGVERMSLPVYTAS